MARDNKDKQVYARMTSQEYAKFLYALKEKKMTISEYVKTAVLKQMSLDSIEKKCVVCGCVVKGDNNE